MFTRHFLAPTNTSPLAICFIHSYRASLLLHGLFALEDRSVELINTLFSTICFDFMRLLEEYFDILVQAIEDGKVPEFEGAESVHHHLQVCVYRSMTRIQISLTIANSLS